MGLIEAILLGVQFKRSVSLITCNVFLVDNIFWVVDRMWLLCKTVCELMTYSQVR